MTNFRNLKEFSPFLPKICEIDRCYENWPFLQKLAILKKMLFLLTAPKTPKLYERTNFGSK